MWLNKLYQFNEAQTLPWQHGRHILDELYSNSKAIHLCMDGINILYVQVKGMYKSCFHYIERL